ncbi:uncharacterized protein LTR77_010080 [Saxophila tyrrhenica]|uniref:SET domain-containing protein n=1 Tax=Saxophila tyrrhenica TaxID=1690608 RepID=A0AAV9NWS8_9PEZI|nr:hypothetical protein LTR77_010080 [Saxophila tyrrhenica]
MSSFHADRLCEQRASTLHGQGMFTTQKVSRGTLIFHEKSLASFDDTTDDWPGVWQFYQSLPTAERLAWRSLYNPETAVSKDKMAKEAREYFFTKECGEVLANCLNNCWKDCVTGASFLGIQTSRFNHSCRPNGIWVIIPATGRFEVRATSVIESGQEVLLSYLPLSCMRSARIRELRPFGFECHCSLCSEPDSEEEKNRAAMHNIDQQLWRMDPPGDLNDRILLYAELLRLQTAEECMIWDVLLTATLLQRLYLETEDLDGAASTGTIVQRASDVCHGEDFRMTNEWKNMVVNQLMLPKAKKS